MLFTLTVCTKRDERSRMLRSVRMFPLLEGAWGEEASEVDAVVDAVVRVAVSHGCGRIAWHDQFRSEDCHEITHS